MTNFFQTNRELIYLVYGEAFFILGLVVALQSRKHSRLALARHLWLLALFGIIHGIYEWGSVLILVQQSQLAEESINLLRLLQMSLEAISFLALFQFGSELLADGSPFQILLRGVPTVLLGVWEATMLIQQNSPGLTSLNYFNTGDILARYLLGVPGGAAAAWGLWRHADQVKRMDLARIANYFRGAAYAFAIYAVASAIVPSAIFFPASIFNYDNLIAVISIPAQIFRALCGIIIAYLIIRGLGIFEVETDRLLEEAAQVRAVATDRERIGRELHDNIIQSLYATGLTLQDATLTVEKDAARAKHRIDEAIRALDGTIGDIRNYILDLRRETGAWQTDLGELVRAFRLQTLMDIELVIDSKPVDELKSKEGKELLAIVREALTNVAKHAAATQARVVVMHPNESTQVEIIDNGIGMERNGNGQSSHEGLGLRNMRERAKLIGGRLEINSAPQQGTTVRLIIPKSNESNGETE